MTAAGDGLAEAHRALRADPDVQFNLPPAPKPPEPPQWLKDFGEWWRRVTKPIVDFFRWLDGYLPDIAIVKYLFWGTLAVLAALLLWLVVIRLREGNWRLLRLRRADGPAEAEDDGADWAPAAAPLRAWLEEADALAARGQYAEAVHHLLFRSVDDIARRRPNLVRPALTSRELAAASAIPAGARTLFARIAGIVERGLFAARPVDAEAWGEARAAYAEFALAGAWRQ